MNDLPWFMTAEPPPNYVAGLGRGAQGFTTRSDIGPARNIVDMPSLLGKRAREDGDENGGDEEEEGGMPENSTNLEDEKLFAGMPYDKEDEEADTIWDLIDARMDSRRKERREALQKQGLEKYRANRPKIQQSFADLKQDLKTVSEEEWMNIPEIGDKRTSYKKNKADITFTPLPDTIIAAANRSTQYLPQESSSGFQTPAIGTPIDLTQMSLARKQMMETQIKIVTDSVQGQTNINPRSYITQLNSSENASEVDMIGIKRSRTLLENVTKTNPEHGAAWIAAARVELSAGKLAQARKLVMKGCEKAPKNEEVWLEAAKLHSTDQAKEILARAIVKLPKSVKIWMRAASLENNLRDKQAVYRRALTKITHSEDLWKAAIELEDPEGAKQMLASAVQYIPHCVELWLAWAHLEPVDKARGILNRAIKAIPTDPLIWVEAAKLEEANGNVEKPATIIERAIKSLARKHVTLPREAWLAEAEKAEASGSPITCQALVFETIEQGLEDADKKARWMEDAERCIERRSIQTARAIYAKALHVFPTKKSIWLANAQLERTYGNADTLYALVKRAVEHCPQCETLWLMSAKELWLSGEIERARGVLQEAFAKNRFSEAIWLAAAKLEVETQQPTRARLLLENARKNAGTERVWLKSAQLERELRNQDEEQQLLSKAVELYPKFDKLWMMLGQLYERVQSQEYAIKIYKEGLQECPNSIPLWICASRCEEKQSSAKARSILERARKKNPKTPQLWLEAIRVENRAKNIVMVETLMARALQECPDAGLIWAEAISLEPRKKRAAKVSQALNVCGSDPHVIISAAKMFWEDRKVDKARSWFDRAVTLQPLLGDSWAYFYKFELQHGNEEQRASVIARCTKAEPRYGEKWCSVSKAVENAHQTVAQILNKVVLII